MRTHKRGQSQAGRRRIQPACDSFCKHHYHYFNNLVMYRVIKVVMIETAIGVNMLLKRKERNCRKANSYGCSEGSVKMTPKRCLEGPRVAVMR